MRTHLRLDDGTVWPAPADDETLDRLAHRPDLLTDRDRMRLRSIAQAYAWLIRHPWGAEASAHKARMLRWAWSEGED